MEGLIFSEDLCRLCLWRSNKLLQIFGEEGELQGIPMKIGMCLPISVTRDDVLPKLICSQCIYKLEMFSEFRNSCVRSEQLLKRYTSHEPVQIPTCHTVVVQMQEEVKVEVNESDPIAVEQEVPFMCLISDIVQKETTEDSRSLPVNESVSTMNTDVTKNEGAKEARTSMKEKLEENKKVTRRNPSTKKKSNKTKPAAVKKAHSKHEKEKNNSTSKVSLVPVVVSCKRNLHKCKHCSKNFPSRTKLSHHLTSSNCLFQYTCRYCAKIFGNADNRIRHEKNHRDKSFICRLCKQKFQSSFDLNVHTVNGCKRASVNRQESITTAEGKSSQVKPEENGERKSENEKSDGTSNRISDIKQAHMIKCKYCEKSFGHNLRYGKHLRTCRRAVIMKKINQTRKQRNAKSFASMELQQDKGNGKQKTKNNTQEGIVEGVRVRGSSRKKQDFSDVKTPLQQNSPTKNSSEISPKASLLAVLGLKEKSQQKANEIKNNTASSEVTVEDEVVTVCDICRKIFTSESGMLNHQTTVHNRKLTAEKINSLMRVEI